MSLYLDGLKLMVSELMAVNGHDWQVAEEASELVSMFNTLRTVSRPGEFSDAYFAAEKIYLDREKAGKVLVAIEDIKEELIEGIYIHQGDITAIEADLIVNAANEKLLGCFVPGHECIDNAIHMAAGMGLRNACNKHMVDQGYDEPAGKSHITQGFNLPSKYVAHTVGPNVNGPVRLTKEDVRAQLSACYRSILDEAKGYKDIRQVVFCSISTGIYGVPIELASEIALSTIRDWMLKNDHQIDRVVIDVFSDADYDSYIRKAKEIIESHNDYTRNTPN